MKNQSVFLAAVTKEIPTPQLPHHTRNGATREEARTDLANKRDFRHVMRCGMRERILSRATMATGDEMKSA